MKKIKVLEFFGEPLNYGGQEAFIVNVYSSIDKSKFNFTFMTPFESTNANLIRLVEENNDFLIAGNCLFENKLRKKCILEMAKKNINSSYDVVHIHSGSVFTLYSVAKIAKQKGVKKVIVHSHATGEINLKYRIIKLISDMNIEKYADYFFACSDLAGKWKYSTSILKSNKYMVIKNGIDIKRYSFDKDMRNNYRKKFAFSDEHIIIHVGRFSKEKNQLFILDIFNNLLQYDKNAKLLLVGGNGDLLESVRLKIREFNLEHNVKILINRSDVNYLINMSDVFILPSLWEGLPFTGIEAQANGIPCLFSDTITEQLNITAAYNVFALDRGQVEWAKKIYEMFNLKRCNTSDDIKLAGFDILDVVQILEKIYGDDYE